MLLPSDQGASKILKNARVPSLEREGRSKKDEEIKIFVILFIRLAKRVASRTSKNKLFFLKNR